MVSFGSAVTVPSMAGTVPLLAKAIWGQVLAVRGAIAFHVKTWNWFHSWLCHLLMVAHVTNRKWSRGGSAPRLVMDAGVEGVRWDAAPLLGKQRAPLLSWPILRSIQVMSERLGTE